MRAARTSRTGRATSRRLSLTRSFSPEPLVRAVDQRFQTLDARARRRRRTVRLHPAIERDLARAFDRRRSGRDAERRDQVAVKDEQDDQDEQDEEEDDAEYDSEGNVVMNAGGANGKGKSKTAVKKRPSGNLTKR